MSDSAYGMFEVLAGSDTEQEREQRIAANKLAAAIYDVKDRFGQFVFAARDVNDFNDRIALCKDDMFKVVEPHLFPRTGVMRRICKQLKDEWRKTAEVMDTDETYHPSDDVMVPEGDFHAYQDRVDQGGPGKVDANVFTGEGTQHTGDPALTLFVKGKEAAGKHSDPWNELGPVLNEDTVVADPPELEWQNTPGYERATVKRVRGEEPERKPRHEAVRHFALWCQARGVKPNLDSLERYSSRGLSDKNYFTIAAALQRRADMTVDPTAGGSGGQAPQSLGDAATNAFSGGSGGQAPQPLEQAATDAFAGTQSPSPAVSGTPSLQDAAENAFAGRQGRRRTAAPDYLQKADQALTDLLNQRAEEFQTTIAPLQQALQVVQQAESEQQAANPFNVMPGGQINVMPGGGDPAAGGDPMGGGAPMDPSMGGGAPPMDPSMGADPSMGGGMPPADPAMGADPSGGEMPQDLQRQMMMQSKRGGHPKAEARLAGDNVRVADVVRAWEEWNAKKPQSGGLPTGGEVDYDNFARETGAGNRAIQKLKNHLQAPVVASKHEAAKKEAGVEDYQGHKIKTKKVKDRAGTPGTEVHINGQYHWTYPDHQGGHENAVKMTKRTIDDSIERPDAYEWSRKQGNRKEAWMGWGASQPGVHRVAGFDWDDYLNGYIAHAPGKFACVCGTEVAVPSGFQRCACGKQWNSYVIGTGGDRHEASAEKYLVREIPTRDNVIVASKGEDCDDDCDEDDDNSGDFAVFESDDKREKESSRDFARFVAEAYAAREAAIYKLTEPGELGEGEDPGTATMKQQPEDWAARNADGTFNQTRKRRSL
jgi:hypothetical protein